MNKNPQLGDIENGTVKCNEKAKQMEDSGRGADFMYLGRVLEYDGIARSRTAGK